MFNSFYYFIFGRNHEGASYAYFVWENNLELDLTNMIHKEVILTLFTQP